MGLNKRLIGAGATASGGLTPSENFKVVLYTGDGTASQFIDVGFTPDFVWIKGRDTADYHNLIDSSRTAGCFLNSNNALAEDCNSSHAQIQTNGFNAKGNPNASGKNYVAYCWIAGGGTTSSNTDGTNIDSTVQVNADAGFSIVKFTTPSTFSGSNTVGHGLGATPDMILVKATSTTEDWYVYHTGTGLNKATRLNSNIAAGNATYLWGTVNDTVFNPNYTSTSPITNIAYCFKSIEGYSKFGSYTGNGSANGPIVETGFEPAFIMVKNTTSGGQDWRILDNKRNTSNPRNCYLSANNSNAEECQYDQFDFLSNGFKVITTDGSLNQNTSNFIYMAFAADPDTEAPTLASSFNIETYTGNASTNSITGLGFSPNLIWLKERSGTDRHVLIDNLRGEDSQLSSNNSDAETTYSSNLDSFDTDGFTLGSASETNGNGETYVGWTWKADDNEATIEEVTEDADSVTIYKFEDNYNDVTSTNNISNTSGTSFISGGKFNKAVALSGTSATMDTGITAGSNESWSWWVKFGSSSTGYRVLVCTNTSGDVGQNIEYFSTNTLYIADILGGATNTSQQTSVTLRDDEWHHFVLTKTVTQATLYVDKVEKLSISNATGSSLQSGNNWSFGKGQYGDANSDFKVDQARYFNKVLNAASIENLYNETAAQNDTLNIGTKTTTSAQSIVSANANAGFSIVKYDGSGVSGTKIPHGLSAAPNMTIIKCTSDGSTNWIVHHSSLGNSKYLTLNDSVVEDTSTNWLVPSATTFALNQTFGNANTSGRQYIAYCFHDVTGYQKLGSYLGNAGTQTITTGFKPDFILIKKSSGTGTWRMFDSRRDTDKSLRANDSAAEYDDTQDYLTFISTGFSYTNQSNSDLNENGSTYIYWAIAKNVPSNTTLANSFKAITYTGTGANQKVEGLGFRPDLVWIKSRSTTNTHQLHDTVRGIGQTLKSSDTAAEVNESQYFTGVGDGYLQFGTNAGNYNNTGTNYVAWAWKAGNTWQSNLDGTIGSTVNANTANGFSIIKYTGDGNSSRTVGHGLTAKCDLVIIKGLDSADKWVVQLPQLGDNARMVLEGSAGKTDDSTTAQAGNTTVIGIGGDNAVNKSGDEFIAYCWHSVSGYSNIGSINGNGSTQSITGLGFQPDFVMIKGATVAESWNMYDSVRGATKLVRPNTSEAESTYTDSVTSFDSDGFTLGANTYVNQDTKSYIYMAFKMN